jgi:hypothetical protein
MASSSGVDSILEAAAGKNVSAPANVTKPSAPAKPGVTSAPAEPKQAMPMKSPGIPSGMVVGPILKKASPASLNTATHLPTSAPVAAPVGVPMPHSLAPQQMPQQVAQRAPGIPTSAVTPSPVHSAIPSPMPVSRASAPAGRPAPALASNNQVTAGYINPFIGAPGITQKLSSALSILQLQTKIAKERAAYSKYNSEANTLAMDNSPQLRQLESDVTDLRGKVQSLSIQDARAEQVAREVHQAAVKSHNHMKLIAIVNDQGDRSAIIQTGKETHTVSAGSSIDGHLVRAVDAHQVVLTDGKTLELSQQIGHYRSIGCKETQSNGGIAPPQQSGVLGRLASEAKQNGIVFQGQQQSANGGATPDGMAPLAPGMLHN